MFIYQVQDVYLHIFYSAFGSVEMIGNVRFVDLFGSIVHVFP